MKSIVFFMLIVCCLNLTDSVGVAQGPFELDGNAVQDSPTKDDWSNVVFGSSGALAKVLFVDGVNIDDSEHNGFISGGSKDTNPINMWLHSTTPGIPDKADIEHVFAALYNVDGNLHLYFGLDRTTNNGDTTAGFWFFENPVSTNADGTFSGAHSDGDILLVVDYSNGGAVASISVYKFDTATNILVLVRSSTNLDRCDATLVQSACAITNLVSTPSPWPYTPKSGSANIFSPRTFIEGGINLDELFPGGSKCFSTIMAETRSSNTPSSTLQDFAIHTFDTCSAELTSSCSGELVNGEKFVYTVTVTITNTGISSLTNIQILENGIVKENIASLIGGASQSFSYVFETTSPFTAPSYSFRANFISETPATVLSACPVIPINPALTIEKSCRGVRLELSNNKLTLAVDYHYKVTNTGNTKLINVQISDSPSGFTANLGNIAVGGFIENDGSYFPTVFNTPTTPGTLNGVAFTDTITVTSGNPFNSDSITQSASATCNVC